VRDDGNESSIDFPLTGETAAETDAIARQQLRAYRRSAPRSRRANLRRKWSTTRKASWSWGCVSAIDSNGRTIWIADAHRDNGKRFVVRSDEKLTAFLELESAIRAAERPEDCGAREIKLDGLSGIK
jgi:hypothetical protein